MSCKKRNWDTEAHGGKRVKTQREDGHLYAKERGLGWILLYWPPEEAKPAVTMRLDSESPEWEENTFH